jgi:SAM-dependent methyltransferase
MTHRTVVPEWLDYLSPRDPLAVASRRDLQTLNVWMGNARAIRRILEEFYPAKSPLRVAELGAGDGTFFHRMARGRRRQQISGRVVLLDINPSVSDKTRGDLAGLGWDVEVVAANVFDWLPGQEPLDVLITNLFLHHFDRNGLASLLGLMTDHSKAVIACEPRRCLPALAAGSMLLGLGCNCVTRNDAPISVRAGFRAREISAAWPASGWELREKRAGLFTHLFAARRLP